MTSWAVSPDNKRTKRVSELTATSCDLVLPAEGLPVEQCESQESKEGMGTPVKPISWPSVKRVKRGTEVSSRRRHSRVKILENDIVSQNYRHLPPIQLIERGPNLRDRKPPGEAGSVQAVLGIFMLFIALGIVSAPLFDSSIDAEDLIDNSGILVKKNATYAKAYYLGSGFFDAFVTKMKTDSTAVGWYPQTADTTFLSFPFITPTDFAAYGSGPCAILNTNPANPLECIMMTGHQGGVSAYGLCRNGTEFVSVHYISALTTPADVGGLISAGTWIENLRETIIIGLMEPPTCSTDGRKVTVLPNYKDWRVMSGAFTPSRDGDTNQWFDVMGLPDPVRDRMFYMIGKADTRQGLTLPSVKRQSFDKLIAQNTYGSTLADKLEISAAFTGSKYSYITIYRVAGAKITLPRLQFTFAVAAQSLLLLAYMFALSVRNGVMNSYHFMHQILRSPTFCIISIQLLYVLYYQIFSIAYVSNNPTLIDIYNKKITYAAGVSYILLHQLDVRAAVTLWPRMANNDSYYFTRIVWMLSSLAVFTWSLTIKDPAHYVVATSSKCALGASECNTTDKFFFEHWVCFGVFLAHPFAYGAIQILQWRHDRVEYSPQDYRHPDYLTSFEAYGCGGPLCDAYYYHTLVTKELPDSRGKSEPKYRTLQYLTCAKAVRDEGFVMLGGCHALIRAKDLHVIMITKFLPRSLATTINLSVVVAHIQDNRLTPMRRVSYLSLWTVARRWDGRISYPDIG
ncbi:hypothetical protein Poli38472_013595 [Pythium oligandrum]|uniref:Uncharacterized protein n=1 Tax=Pythium oligandrum TaxID=41045 RepID=A0A8K1CD96_PYTOL|nr:hypothetical protein Poli38472_013595 [Pythium oligandrum]|eukprot:TMW61132.1 hypothetical protein Poli38472_013595 [Pythium oligandrum]